MPNILTLTVTALLLSPAQRDGQSPFGEMSRIGSTYSEIAGVSYLFQGFPEAYVGSGFQYAKPHGQELENYVARLLERPERRELPLRDFALFLASRFFENRNEKPVVVLEKNEAFNYYYSYIMSMKADKGYGGLLLHALKAYLDLGRGIKPSFGEWKGSHNSAQWEVRQNVEALCRTASVTTNIGKGYIHPFPGR